MSVVEHCTDVASGPKAAMLRRLQEAGFRVPEFVVSPANVDEALRQLGTPVAVRSSADVEDGEQTSFAGQFRSFLNLSTSADVEEAIDQCRASARSDSVVSYCRRNGIDPECVQVDAIVQRMVQPDIAGVAFTVNPLTGAQEVVIEACEGLGDELLSGRCEPLAAGHAILERHRAEIEFAARKIQRLLGAPQDVEFAIADDTLYILQSRPITRIGFAAESGEWTNADFRDGGVSSSVCSPLMWSLYEFVWDRTLKEALKELKLFRRDFEASRMFFGRPYWNVGEVKECLMRLPGFIERDFDNDLSIEPTYLGTGRQTPVTLKGILRAVPTLWALPRFFRRQEQFADAFLSGGFEAIAKKYATLADDPAVAFGQLIEHEFFLTESNYFRTIFATSLAKMDFTSSFPETDYSRLVAALPPLRHMRPVTDVEQLTDRDDTSLAAIVTRYRHHYRLGLDIRFPRWDEDREFVIKMLRELPLARDGRDRFAAFESARADAVSRLPKWKQRSFQRKLDRLRKFVWLREEMRDLSSQMYYLLRQHALEIGQRRDLGDDIFFMTFPEIIADDCSQIDRYREIYESYRNFKAPNEIGACYCTAQRTGPSSETWLTGIGASPGVATGEVHIARTVCDALAMPRGRILVCPFTDPGWTPVLERAAAVVTETGGLLSHAAVICREYGIPAVLGIADATNRLADKSVVTVRGNEGRVELVE